MIGLLFKADKFFKVFHFFLRYHSSVISFGGILIKLANLVFVWVSLSVRIYGYLVDNGVCILFDLSVCLFLKSAVY